MNLRSTLLSLFMFPVCVFAGVTGNYTVEGHDPANVEYTGTLAITKSGSVYTANWSFSDGHTEFGTGVRNNDSIAFVFSEAKPGAVSGVQLYAIRGDVLEGPWVDQGATEKGFERATKVHDHSHHSHHSH
jgi:hypothetical protein